MREEPIFNHILVHYQDHLLELLGGIERAVEDVRESVVARYVQVVDALEVVTQLVKVFVIKAVLRGLARTRGNLLFNLLCSQRFWQKQVFVLPADFKDLALNLAYLLLKLPEYFAREALLAMRV